jgi:hypothetical protein
MAEEKGAPASSPIRRLIPLAQFNKYHPDPSPAALRWLRYRNPNDFNRCVVKRGHRVLIDEAEYFRWLAECNAQESK